MTKQQLYERLKNYQFEDLVPPTMWEKLKARFGDSNASAKAFANKVASKNGWTLEFALRALEEYKKYVFLGVTAKSPVTPSKVIDAVWHEHCLFMEGYRHFRQKVIEHDFLHYPELIPAADNNKVYRQQYLNTVALYLHEFGQLPPADIWARPKYPPRPGGIRARQKHSVTHEDENEYDLEELVDVLQEILEGLELEGRPLHEILHGEAAEQLSTYSEPAPPSSTHVDLEAPLPIHHDVASHVADTISHHSDSGADTGPSCSSSSCGSGCGGGGGD